MTAALPDDGRALPERLAFPTLADILDVKGNRPARALIISIAFLTSRLATSLKGQYHLPEPLLMALEVVGIASLELSFVLPLSNSAATVSLFQAVPR